MTKPFDCNFWLLLFIVGGGWVGLGRVGSLMMVMMMMMMMIAAASCSCRQS
jgi:hypothetical protein